MLNKGKLIQKNILEEIYYKTFHSNEPRLCETVH